MHGNQIITQTFEIMKYYNGHILLDELLNTLTAEGYQLFKNLLFTLKHLNLKPLFSFRKYLLAEW